MKMNDLPKPIQREIKEALLDQLDKQIKSRDLPGLMKMENISIGEKTISMELFGVEKVAEVTIDKKNYQISRLKIVEEDGEQEE